MSDGMLNPTISPAANEPMPPGNARAEASDLPSATPVRAGAGLLLAAKLIGVLAIAIGVRLWILTQPGLGHAEDLSLFVRWTRGLMEHGLAGFYNAESFCDYPPLMVLLFRGVGATIGLWTGPAPDAYELRLGIKALACLADLAIGILLLFEGRRLLGECAGLLACGLYLLNPVALYDSAYWGQMDAVYTAFVLSALVLVGRRRWGGAGVAAAASLAAKFQAIAILPIVVLEAYRLGSWQGLRRMCAGGAVGLAAIAAPFLATGQLREAVDRAYVRVIGQYHEMSKNAYNIWHVFGDPEAADVSPPTAVVRLAAAGRDVVRTDESWLLKLTWRRISLMIFALSVAVVLSLYALRPGPVARFGAAGLLALCFFLFPTEMHERYAYPAMALLAVWAAARAVNERIYWVLTILLLLNLAAVLPAAPLAPQIAVANLVVLGLILLGLLLARSSADVWKVKPLRPAERTGDDSARPLIPAFQCATAIALVGALGLTAWIQSRSHSLPTAVQEPGTVWLSSLRPRLAEQGWKTLAIDRAVSGGHLQLGDSIYLRGLGTHAPATLVYDIPPDCVQFQTIAGVDTAGRRRGSVILRVELDGECVFTSPELTGQSDPLPVRIPLAGASRLTLKADPAGDGKRSDHLNLALARFIRTAAADDERSGLESVAALAPQ